MAARSDAQKKADKKYESKRKSIPRGRYFTALVYPESAKDNWIEIIKESGVKCFISPLHDKDVYAEDVAEHKAGEPKKAHYHVMFEFPKVQRATAVEKILLAACGEDTSRKVEKVTDEEAMLRYFWHENDPEKYQYSKADVIAIGGACVEDILLKNGLSAAESRRVSKEIVQYIIENHEVDFISLVSLALAEGKEDWYEYLQKNTNFITACLRSEEYKYNPRRTQKIVTLDSETGEVID